MHSFVLTWLCAVPQPIVNMLPVAVGEQRSLASVEPCTLADMSTDLLRAISSSLGFPSLYAASTTSKRLLELLLPVLQARYGIKCNEKVYLYYSTILDEFAALQIDAFENRTAAEAVAARRDSLHYMGIEAALEAEFGFCIHHWEGGLQFVPKLALIDMLYDERTTSALPYLLDQNPRHFEWIACIQGLVELGRFDLLGLLTFPKINEKKFYTLLTVSLPEPVVRAAARSLHRREPDLRLSKLLAFAVLQDKDACAPEGRVPLFILQYMHENRLAVPGDWVFTDGLRSQSISFWMYLPAKKPGEVVELLGAVLEHCDYATRCMADAFYREVSTQSIPRSKDRYGAMLTRFRFSLHCTDAIRANCERMFERLPHIGYYGTHAPLDCGKSELLGEFADYHNLSSHAIKGLMARMYRLGDKNLPMLVRNYLEGNDRAPLLLKTLIQQRIDGEYVQPVWDWIQSKQGLRTIGTSCCRMSTASLKSLVSERGISVEAAEGLPSEVGGYQAEDDMVSMDVAVLYMVISWEAPEKVITYHLDRSSPERALDYKTVRHLKWSAKHLAILWSQLVKRFRPLGGDWRPDFGSFRLQWNSSYVFGITGCWCRSSKSPCVDPVVPSKCSVGIRRVCISNLRSVHA